MPLFYFHVRGPAGLDRDQIGLDLDGVEAAYLEAYASVLGMAAEMLSQKVSPFRYAFEIMDAGGTLLMEVPFSEVLDRGRRSVRPGKHQQARQRACAQAERTVRLVADICEEQKALRANLIETKRLLAEARRAAGSSS